MTQEELNKKRLEKDSEALDFNVVFEERTYNVFSAGGGHMDVEPMTAEVVVPLLVNSKTLKKGGRLILEMHKKVCPKKAAAPAWEQAHKAETKKRKKGEDDAAKTASNGQTPKKTKNGTAVTV